MCHGDVIVQAIEMATDRVRTQALSILASDTVLSQVQSTLCVCFRKNAHICAFTICNPKEKR